MTVFSDQRLPEKLKQLHLVRLAVLPSSGTFVDLLVTDKVFPEVSDPDGEEVTGDRLAPVTFTVEERRFKAALGDPILVMNEDTITAFDAAGRRIVGRAIDGSILFNNLDAAFVEVFLDERVGFVNFEDFVVFQRRPSPALQCATCPFALQKIAAKGSVFHVIVNDGLTDYEHWIPRPS